MADDASAHPEKWLPIKGYEGLYDVSDQGRVRSLWLAASRANRARHSPVMLRPSKGKYQQVVLVKDRVRAPRLIHVLVLETFVGPCPPGMEGAHENGRPRDNWLSNLAWKTHRANCADKLAHGTHQAREANPAAKLTESEVSAIRSAYSPNSRTNGRRALGRRFGISPSQVGNIVHGRAWPVASIQEGERA